MNKFGTAVILCGGKSSRMGFDKCKIRIKDRLLIEIIAEKLEEIFQEVIFISNDRKRFQDIKYKVYEDIIPNSGPIGAIYSALKYASSEHVFVTACDMPFVNLDLIKYMMELIELENVEGVVSHKGEYVEPLYSFYSKSMIERIENQIKDQNYKLIGIINNSKIHYIKESDVRKYSEDLDVFTNLNYQKDLTALAKIFLEGNDK